MPVRRDKTGRWRYREMVLLPDGTRTRISGSAPKRCNTKAACQQALLDHIERIRNARPESEQRQRAKQLEAKEVPRFEDFAQVFLDSYAKTNNKPSEQINKECVLRTKLKPFFRSRTLDDIRYSDVEDLKAHLLSKGLSPKTVNNTLTVLSKMLKYAADRELIENVPRVKFLKVQAPDFDFLDFEDLDRLVSAAKVEADTYAMVLLAADAGLRVGEIRALKWEDIDLVRGLVTVQRTDYRGHLGSTKGGRIRRVPLTRRLTAALKAHRHLIAPWVLCSLDGERLTRGEADAKLWRACRRAGLRKITWHVLRHTFCSHLAMKGAPPKAIQELAGHQSLMTTQRYMHLSPGASRAAIALLEDGPGSESPRDADTAWQNYGKKPGLPPGHSRNPQ